MAETLIGKWPVFEYGWSKARLNAAKAALKKVEGNMTPMDDGKVLDNIAVVDPKIASRTLFRLAGRNKRADELLAIVYADARKGNIRAMKIARGLSSSISRFHIAGDTSEVGADGTMEKGELPALLAPFLSAEIKHANQLIDHAEKGEPVALDKIKQIIKSASEGNIKAKHFVDVLRAANTCRKAGICVPCPPSPNDIVGFSLSDLDPTRKENSGLSMLITALPGGAAVMAAANTAATLNNAAKKLKVAAKKPGATAADVKKAAEVEIKAAKAAKIAESKLDAVKKKHEPPTENPKRSTAGIYIPSWNDENGKAIRGAATGVLVDMRERGIAFRPYGNTDARTVHALLPMIEEELRTRTVSLGTGLAKKPQGRRWWQADPDSAYGKSI